MIKPPSGEIREAAMAVASAAVEAAELVRNDSSDSCVVEDDKKYLLSKGMYFCKVFEARCHTPNIMFNLSYVKS